MNILLYSAPYINWEQQLPVQTIEESTRLSKTICHIIFIYAGTVHDLIKGVLTHGIDTQLISATIKRETIVKLDLSTSPCWQSNWLQSMAQSPLIMRGDFNACRMIGKEQYTECLKRVEDLFSQLSLLEDLNMSYCAMNDAIVDSITKYCPLLTTFDMSGNVSLTITCIEDFLPRLRQLTSLSLREIVTKSIKNYDSEDDVRDLDGYVLKEFLCFNPVSPEYCRSLNKISSLTALDISGNSTQTGRMSFPPYFIDVVCKLHKIIINKACLQRIRGHRIEQPVTEKQVRHLKQCAPKTIIISDITDPSKEYCTENKIALNKIAFKEVKKLNPKLQMKAFLLQELSCLTIET